MVHGHFNKYRVGHKKRGTLLLSISSDYWPIIKILSLVHSANNLQQEGAAVEGPPAMGPSLQLSTCVLFWGFLGLCKAARDPYATCQISSWSNNRRRSYGDFSPTAQLSAMTLTSDPLTLKLVHGVLVSQGPFLPSLAFVGLFVFPLGGGTGQTDRWTGSTHDGAPSRKDGLIIMWLLYIPPHGKCVSTLHCEI